MIYLYSGTPGSGKSLNVSRKLYYYLKSKPVIANFYYNTDLIKTKKEIIYKEISNYELTPKVLKDFSINYFKNNKFKEGTILLVIDEAQILFNSRDWNKKGRDSWLEFFTQHRKFGYDIILVSQFDRMLDRQIRSLIEYEYIHRKVSNFGKFGKILSIFSLGQLFVSVKVWYPMREKVGSNFFRASKKYFKMYDSYNIFNYSN